MRRITFLIAISFSCGCDLSRAGVGQSLQGTNYVVRPGESLFAIAERAYGNGLEWPRIWEANPWVDPDRLRAGETIHVPPRGDEWGDPAPYKRSAVEGSGGTNDGADQSLFGGPAAGAQDFPGAEIFHNIAADVRHKTFLGFPVHRSLLFAVVFFLGHSLVQSVLVWLTANLTFVKEATMKKASKAIFQTGLLTFVTLVVVAAIGMILFYLGGAGSPAAAATGERLFPGFESFLGTRAGAGLAVFALLAVYTLLSLRFVPQAFGIQKTRGATLTTLAVLVPHLGAIYLVGQRLGWIA